MVPKNHAEDAPTTAIGRAEPSGATRGSHPTRGTRAPPAQLGRKSSSRVLLLGALTLGTFLLLVTLTYFMLTYNPPPGPDSRRPHIVFILADDLGWADLSYTGVAQIRTPNIDALAWNGVRLSRLYHQNLCTPSRAAIMTGRYPIHTGMQHLVILYGEPRGLPLNLKLLPEWLNELGYTSHMLGKWHLGFCKASYTPTKRGFVSHIGNYGGSVEYYTHLRVSAGDVGLDFRRNFTRATRDNGWYYTDLITSEAVNIIKDNPPNKPMFLYVAHLATHYSSARERLEVPEHYLRGYESIRHANRTRYAGMVAALDHSVGQIVSALDEAGILNNTFLVFASDNGAATTFWDTHGASSWPLRGEKDTLFEGGVRVPGIVWAPAPLWHGVGTEYDRFFHATDWLPTLYEVAGGDASKLSGIDGVSHLRSLKDPTVPTPRNEVLLNIDPTDGNAALIQAPYKLVSGSFPRASTDWLPLPGEREKADTESQHAREACMNSTVFKVFKKRGLTPSCGTKGDAYSTPISCSAGDESKSVCNSTQAPCLFDIVADPCEYRNIAEEKPQIVQQLQARVNELGKTAMKPNNVPKDPAALPKNHGGFWVTWKDDVPV